VQTQGCRHRGADTGVQTQGWRDRGADTGVQTQERTDRDERQGCGKSGVWGLETGIVHIKI